MIPTSQTLGPESYTARPGKLRYPEVLIVVDGETIPSRGAMLAESLHGRWAVGQKGHWLTPARAEKWFLLWTGGFSARGFRIVGRMVWRYEGQGWANLRLHEAMRTLKGRVP